MAAYFLDTSALIKRHVNETGSKMGLEAVTLVSADRELNTAAVAEGLAVEDPTTHP
jgi:hypothetical protein